MTNKIDLTPEAVERFDLEQPDSHMGSASMVIQPRHGDWVRYEDFAALSARLAEVEAEREAFKANADWMYSERMDAQERAEAAEAKLAQAVKALRGAAEYLDDYSPLTGNAIETSASKHIRATLAEIGDDT